MCWIGTWALFYPENYCCVSGSLIVFSGKFQCVRTWCKEWQLSMLLPVTQGRVRSLALAWEQARAALQERQNSARTSPQISPRDAGSSGPPSAAASPRQLDPPVPTGARPAHGSGQPPLPGGDSPVARSRHGRSRSVPYLSPCDSAYDADGRPGRQQEKGGTTGDGDGPSVSPRSQSEAQLSPAKAGSMARASAGGSPDRYYRHPPVSSVGLAKLQVSHLTLTCSDWETCTLVHLLCGTIVDLLSSCSRVCGVCAGLAGDAEAEGVHQAGKYSGAASEEQQLGGNNIARCQRP